MARKNKASQYVVWAILGLLFVGLAGFGTGNFGGSIQSVAKVGEVEIGIDDYVRELQQELRRFSEQTGQSFTIDQARALGLDRVVLARLAGEAALENQTRAIGLSVGDENVAEQVTELGAFRGADGNFDRQAYSFALENAGMTVSEFEDRVRSDTARNILRASITAGIAAPDAYVMEIFGYAAETRDVTWVRLAAGETDALGTVPGITALRAFYADNPDMFTLPETRQVTYAWVTPDMLADDIDITEEEMRAAYDADQDRFNRPERRLVERLVYGSEADAQAARDRLDAGEVSFEDLVAERGLELGDVDMGDVAKRDLGEAGDGVFALDGPGVAGPLTSSLGPALFRVNAILPARVTSFDEARDILRPSLAADAARRMIDDRLVTFEDLLAAGATVEELAADTIMEGGTIAYHDGVTDGIAARPAFRTAVMDLEEGDFPELLELAGGGLFAARLDEIRPPELQAFETVRDAVSAAWRADQINRQLIARAQEIQAAAEAGKSFADQGLAVEAAPALTRDARPEGTPPQFAENVFQMAAGDVRVFSTEAGVVVARLNAIAAPDPTTEDAAIAIDQFGEQTAAEIAGDLLQLFTAAAQNNVEISVDQAALNAVFAQLP